MPKAWMSGCSGTLLSSAQCYIACNYVVFGGYFDLYNKTLGKEDY
jgi:hypothetical protein